MVEKGGDLKALDKVRRNLEGCMQYWLVWEKPRVCDADRVTPARLLAFCVSVFFENIC